MQEIFKTALTLRQFLKVPSWTQKNTQVRNKLNPGTHIRYEMCVVVSTAEVSIKDGKGITMQNSALKARLDSSYLSGANQSWIEQLCEDYNRS
ncbi:hypothetical protein DMI65_20770 [Escherichia coli]|nr:hypothetical protein [Escherichia coli]